MSNANDLPLQLQNHRQLEQASCAVSAFECIAKLHGLIDPKSFPYQSDPVNQYKGFDDKEFLESLGIYLLDDHYDIESTMGLIEKETNEGRFPLVSLLAEIHKNIQDEKTYLYYHVYLCALHKEELILVDPALPSIKANTSKGLVKEFQQNLDWNPDPSRKTKVHLAIYSLRAKAE